MEQRESRFLADFLVTANNKKFAIETKSSKIKVNNERAIEQGKSYTKLLGISYFVICNGIEFVVYKKTQSRESVFKPILKCKLEQYKKIKDCFLKEGFLQKDTKNKTDIFDDMLKGDTKAVKLRTKNFIKKKAKQNKRILKNFVKKKAQQKVEDFLDRLF